MPNTPIRLALAGATGRIGSLVLAECLQALDVECCSALVSRDNPRLGEDLGVLWETRPSREFDVLLDLSLPAALEDWIQACADSGAALVVGATGHSAEQLEALHALSQSVAVLRAPNLALGPNLLMALVREAARQLGDDFEVGISEVHHKHKRDAPSGTARALAEAIRAGSGAEPAISSLRMGQVSGEHSVRFSSGTETLTLSHRAESPLVFAQGALRAVRWIAGREPGLYGMQDLLG